LQGLQFKPKTVPLRSELTDALLGARRQRGRFACVRQQGAWALHGHAAARHAVTQGQSATQVLRLERGLARLALERCQPLPEPCDGIATTRKEDVLNEKGIVVIPDIFLNAGGVTVSYFEWLKNLSHVRFGRLGKRYDEASGRNMISVVENMTGKTATAAQKNLVERGADELDLVYSGLEETMITAYHTIRSEFKSTPGIKDLRTAAFVVAIRKIAKSYDTLGVFP